MDKPSKLSFTKTFSTTEDEQLVSMVQMHEYLYDLKHALHNEQSVRDNAWQDISQILERPVEDCKKRWKNIKDAHRRRKIGKYAGTGKSPLIKLLSFLDNVQGRNSRRTDKNCHIKLEIEKARKHGNTSSTTIKTENNHTPSETYNLDSDDSMEQNEHITDTQFPDPLATLQKTFDHDSEQEYEKTCKNFNLNENTLSVLERLKKIVEKEEDSVDLFFRSLSMSVKNLQPHLINEAKIKMLQLVIDLENQNT